MKKHINKPADIITASRIILSIIILFVPMFSLPFYILYSLAGFTDMIDGTVARKTGTVSEKGARLDTAADFVFVAVCLVKLLLTVELSALIIAYICIVAAVKLSGIIWGFVVKKTLVSKHFLLNKITGLLLFAFPFSLKIIEIKYSSFFIFLIALASSLWELYLIISEK